MAKNTDKSREIRLWTKMIMRAIRAFILSLILIPSWREYVVSKMEYWKLRTEEKINDIKERRGER